MEAPRSVADRGRLVYLALASTLVIGAAVFAGPRPVGDVTPQGVERAEFIGFSRIDEMSPLPPNARANILVQPLGMAVPIFEVISDEMAARGSVANTAAATAIVYRNSHDSGYANYNKSTQGNFVGNLLHLGNGFPVNGGEIKGFDLLIYNDHMGPGGDAACTVSLWDGDPLGIIDTRISDPPQPIPGTTCTFSGLAKSYVPPPWGCTIDTDGDGIPDTCYGDPEPGGPCVTDWDCGICGGPVEGDDIPDCPGLYRLVCDFDPKVTIPSRNVWMIVEWTEGCRMGWRWAHLHWPEIAAVGEENFCADTCPNAQWPCVDMAIEMVDAASQWDSVGVGTCCEDPGIACDHSDGVFECGHGTSCSDGEATDFDAWCFGAPSYFASFVASIYANTDTRFSLVPVGSSGPHTIVGNEIIMPAGGQTVNLEAFAAGWDPDFDGYPMINTWQAQIDSSTYTSGLAGELTNSRPSCTDDAHCPDYATDELCTGTYCGGAWIERHRSPFHLWLPACDVSAPNPRCGSTGWDQFVDPGEPVYAMSVRLEASADAKGTFEVDFVPTPATFMKGADARPVPLVGYISAKITIEIGKCCDRSGGLGNERCLDNLTVGECDSIECGPFCGDDEVNQTWEECDGTDEAACPGLCGLDCLCAPFCGDSEVNQWSEECDGIDDSACPGACEDDCLCGPFCGDDVVNQESEVCDGADAIRCPGQCQENCTCPTGSIPAVSQWGLVVLMLLLLTGAKIYHGRRRAFT